MDSSTQQLYIHLEIVQVHLHVLDKLVCQVDQVTPYGLTHSSLQKSIEIILLISETPCKECENVLHCFNMGSINVLQHTQHDKRRIILSCAQERNDW